jgi:hypothetical protein
MIIVRQPVLNLATTVILTVDEDFRIVCASYNVLMALESIEECSGTRFSQ